MTDISKETEQTQTMTSDEQFNSDGLFKRLFEKQTESYKSHNINEVSDIFAVKNFAEGQIKTKLDSVNAIDNDDNKFFIEFLLSDNVSISELESQLIKGIPSSLRGLVYLKQFNVNYQIAEERYTNLLNKSVRLTGLPFKEKIEELSLNPEVKDSLRVYNYYIHEIASTEQELITTGSNAIDFIFRVATLFDNVPNLSREEILYLFIKLNKLIINNEVEEYYYKVKRSLEDLVPEVFLHISKQGINLTDVIRRKTFCLFNNDNGNDSNDNDIRILDFIVFQGFDFLISLFVYLFQEESGFILSKEGTELNNYLLGDKSLISKFSIENVVTINPELIKYENEYHLIHINSISNNGHELLKSKEINHALKREVEDLNHQLDNLNTSHQEVLSQTQEFETMIQEAQNKYETLSDQHNKTKVQFDALSMKSNLDNTIKANKEFSQRNYELEEQIKAYKKSVEDKSAKLAKYS